MTTALDRLLRDTRLLITVGSGGVGKTTTAAALAIAGARAGRRAAVLTIDPAKRLAQALGVDNMGNTPKPLDPTLTAPGTVDAMMLEAAEALDDLVARLVPDPARRKRLFENRLYQVIARHLGGTHEYMAVEKMYALMNDPRYDLVVIDTPPSVNALDFLDAPTRLAAFFSDKVTRWFVHKSDDQRSMLQRLKDKAGEMAMGVLGKALGEGFVTELMDFATAFQGLFQAFQERGAAAEAILRDPRTAFVVVSGADALRVAEAAELKKSLAGLNIHPRGYVANRVHLSHADVLPAFGVDDIQQALPGRTDAVQVHTALKRAADVRAALARRDRQGLLTLRGLAGAERMFVVPELLEEVGDRGAIEHLLRALALPHKGE